MVSSLLGGLGTALSAGTKSFQAAQLFGEKKKETLAKTTAASAALTLKTRADQRAQDKEARLIEQAKFTRVSNIVDRDLKVAADQIKKGDLVNAQKTFQSLSQSKALEEFPGLKASILNLQNASQENQLLFADAVSKMNKVINSSDIDEIRIATRDLTAASRLTGNLENMASILKRANDRIGVTDDEINRIASEQLKAKSDAQNIQNLQTINQSLENLQKEKQIFQGQGKDTTRINNRIATLTQQKTQMEGLTAGTRTDIARTAIVQEEAAEATREKTRSETVKEVTGKTPFEVERFLRNDFAAKQIVKDFVTVSRQVEVMDKAVEEALSSGSNIAVDQALITLFNKMLDPTSVVRESEYARTAQDQSLFSKIKGKFEKLKTGGAGLTNEERKAIRRMGKLFAKETEKRYNGELNFFQGLATKSGVDPKTIAAPLPEVIVNPRQQGQAGSPSQQKTLTPEQTTQLNGIQSVIDKAKFLKDQGFSKEQTKRILRIQ